MIVAGDAIRPMSPVGVLLRLATASTRFVRRHLIDQVLLL